MLTKNYTPIIIILIFIIISLTLVLIFGLWKPKHVEKYIAKLQNVRENLKFTGSEQDFISLISSSIPNESYDKNIVDVGKKYWKKLGDRIKSNMILILKHPVNGPRVIKDPIKRKSGLKRLERATHGPTVGPSEGTYTSNKETVYMCDPNHHDENTVIHVWVHEYAHVVNDTYGHDESWQHIFDVFQTIATEQGWFDREKPLKLDTYCSGKYDG